MVEIEKSRNYFMNIKSKYILKKLFEYLHQIKLLNIIRYSSTLKNKLNISLDDYKKYAKIEIEIIPEENSRGRFISIPDENSYFYHIYFQTIN